MRLNTLLVVASQLVIALAPLLTMPHLTRTIGPQGLGTYSLSFSVAAIFLAIGQLGAQLYGRREIAGASTFYKRTRIFWQLSSLVFRTTTLVAVIYVLVVIHILPVDKTLQWALLAQLIYLLSGSIDISWLLHGVERFRLVTMAIVISRVVNVAWIYLAIKTPDDTLLYVYIMSLTFLLTSLIPWTVAHNFIGKPQFRDFLNIKHLGPLRHFIVPAVALNLFGAVNIGIIGAVLSTTEVGLYDLAFRLARSPITLITAVGVVLLPRATALLAKNDSRSQNRYMHRGMTLTMFMASLICFGLIGTADSFVPLFAGASFSGSIPILRVLSVSLLIIGWGNVLRTQIILPSGLDRVYSGSLVVGLIASCFMSVVLIHPFGILGAAIGFTFGEFIVAVVQTYFVRNSVRLKRLMGIAFRYVLIGAITCAFMLSVQLFTLDLTITFVLQVCIGVASFVLLSVGAEYIASDHVVTEEIRRIARLIPGIRKHKRVNSK